MACRIYRIDVQDLNSTSGVSKAQGNSNPAYDPVARVIHFVWTCMTSDVGQVVGGSPGKNHNLGVYHRTFDVTTETFSAVHTIAYRDMPGDTVITDFDQVDTCGLLRDPSTGELMAIYGDGDNCVMRSSFDNGVTWSAEIYVPSGGRFSFQEYLACAIAPNGDVYVWTQREAGGGGINDTYLWKRPYSAITPNTTFIGMGLFDDGTALSVILDPGRKSNSNTAVIKEDGTTAFAIFQREDTNRDVRVTSYWTTDGWTTVHQTTVRLAPGGSTDPSYSSFYPIVVRGQSNTDRSWIMWIEYDGTIGAQPYRPYFAYTDDWGQTWTIVGSPLSMVGIDWDPDWDRAFTIDYADRLYVSVFDRVGLANVHKAWSNATPLDLTTWVSDDCLVDTIAEWRESPYCCGHAFYCVLADNSTKFFRIFNKSLPANADGYEIEQYNLLVKTLFVPPPPPPPPPPVPEDTRMFRRGVLQATRVGIPQPRANAVRSLEEAVAPPGVH